MLQSVKVVHPPIRVDGYKLGSQTWAVNNPKFHGTTDRHRTLCGQEVHDNWDEADKGSKVTCLRCLKTLLRM